MSVPDTSINPRLFDSAKKEFLEKGFLNASLKSICDAAGITTGALYKRYKGKEDLFCAVVKEAVESLESFLAKRTGINFNNYTDEQLKQSWDMKGHDSQNSFMIDIFKDLWKVKESFVILISKSSGTKYENFSHEFVEKMEVSYMQFYKAVFYRGIAKEKITKKEMHILCFSFWTSICEPFIHNMSWKEIQNHCKVITRFFDWQAAVGI